MWVVRAGHIYICWRFSHIDFVSRVIRRTSIMEKKAVILLMVGLIGVAMVLAGVVFIATEFFEKEIHKKVEQVRHIKCSA